MMDKHRILEEIRRTAKDGKAPGQRRFATETGIKEHHWRGKFWANWGDALREAGFEPNDWTGAHTESLVFELLAILTRKLGKFPTKSEMQLERRSNSAFPDPKSIYRIAGKALLVTRLKEYCEVRTDYDDVQHILVGSELSPKEIRTDANISAQTDGYVYLVKAQNAHKIGYTRAPYRRVAEIVNQSAHGAELVHLIPTDDPEGIEKYWHDRFEEKRIVGRNKQSGEWFQLLRDDVRAFSRRKGFM